MAKTVLLAFVSILLVAAIIVSPDIAFQASLQGLTVWWNIVFPGLLPFLVLFELIAAFGLAHAFAALIAPVTTRLLRLPGESALTIILGWLGGYPAGAEAAASLRKRQIVTKQQGQRLLALSHMPNPLFILVVLGAGFLRQPVAAILIGASVWLSAILLMLLTAWLNGRKDHASIDATAPWELDSSTASPPDGAVSRAGSTSDRYALRNQTAFSSTGILPATPIDSPKGNVNASAIHPSRRMGLLASAAHAMSLGREQDGRSLGKALGDSVTASVQKLMVVGGFMIFAAVLAALAAPLLSPLLNRLKLGFALQALLEGHLGAYAAASWDGPGAGLLASAAAVAAVLAWTGLSGIMQAGYYVAGTDLRLLPFVAARAVHALLAAVCLLLLWQPATALLRRFLAPEAVPAFTGQERLWPLGNELVVRASSLPSLWLYSAATCLCIIAAVMLLTLPIRRSLKSK